MRSLYISDPRTPRMIRLLIVPDCRFGPLLRLELLFFSLAL